MDYKFYHLNLLRSKEYIKHYLKDHRDFDIKKSKIMFNKKLINKHSKK